MESKGGGNTKERRQIHKYEVSVLILEGLCSSGEASHSVAEIAKIQVCVFVCHHWCSGRETLYLCCALGLPGAHALNNKNLHNDSGRIFPFNTDAKFDFWEWEKKKKSPFSELLKLTLERQKEGRMMLLQLLIAALSHQHTVLELCFFRHFPTILVHNKTFTQPQPVNGFYFFS